MFEFWIRGPWFSMKSSGDRDPHLLSCLERMLTCPYPRVNYGLLAAEGCLPCYCGEIAKSERNPWPQPTCSSFFTWCISLFLFHCHVPFGPKFTRGIWTKDLDTWTIAVQVFIYFNTPLWYADSHLTVLQCQQLLDRWPKCLTCNKACQQVRFDTGLIAVQTQSSLAKGWFCG